MAKTKVSEWDSTPANNTDVGGVGIRGSDNLSNANDAIQNMMAQIKAGVATTDTANTFTATQTIKRTLNMTADSGGDAIMNFFATDGTTRTGNIYHAAADSTMRLEKRSSGGSVISSLQLGNNLIATNGVIEAGATATDVVVNVGRTNTNRSSRAVQGVSIGPGVSSNAALVASIMGSGATASAPAEIGRVASGAGNLLGWYVNNSNVGVVSVDGSGVVTYGTFCGVHWSQFYDNSKPDMLVGTILETIDEMCAWPGEENAQLARVKVSDTVGSKAVYGVFSTWDGQEEGETTNDMKVASLGAYVVRIAPGVTVQMGDLIESNGNGCGRVQADDIFRSSTVAKVTATHHTYDYPDGSYCVPCTLHCG